MVYAKSYSTQQQQQCESDLIDETFDLFYAPIDCHQDDPIHKSQQEDFYEERKSISEAIEHEERYAAMHETEEDDEPEMIETECNICYTTMYEPCTLPCRHSFCMTCIRAFFKRRIECLLCRAVPPEHYRV